MLPPLDRPQTVAFSRLTGLTLLLAAAVVALVQLSAVIPVANPGKPGAAASLKPVEENPLRLVAHFVSIT
jgi:hypothetical protein